MTGITGLRGTGEFSTDFRPTNYRQMYTLLEPNGSAPLNALLAFGSSEETDDPKYNNFRDELPERTMTVNGAVADTTTTAVTVDAGGDQGYVRVGTLVLNLSTGEIMKSTANAATNDLTLSRNIGGTSYTIADNAVLVIIGSAHSEGSGSVDPVSFDATLAYNYCQIFKTPFAITGTAKETFFRTGDKYDEYASKALKLHMMDIERNMFYGIRAIENASSAQPTRFTGGLFNTLTTNVKDVSAHTNSGQWDEDGFDRWLIETAFAFGSKEKVVFCGAKIAGHIQQFAKNRWAPVDIDATYGVNVTGYKTTAGTLMVHLHPQFRQIPTLDAKAVLLDFPYLKFRHMKNRDTHIQENIQNNDEDQRKDQYMSECGLELLQEKVHSVIEGWDTVGAPG